MECQLRVCRAYRLSLSLKKSHIFPQHFEFFGNDVSPDGNRPAQTKHQLLESWLHPEIVRDIAKFIGFAQFYSVYIHHFELRIAPLQEINHYFRIHRPRGPTVVRRRSVLNGRREGRCPFRSLSDALQPQSPCCPSHRFFIPWIRLCCLQTGDG